MRLKKPLINKPYPKPSYDLIELYARDWSLDEGPEMPTIAWAREEWNKRGEKEAADE